MNNAMVKPIPPRRPTPTIARQSMRSGNSAMPALTASQAKPTIPIGLPRSSPKKAPSETAETRAPWLSAITTPALNRANTGMIR